MTTNEQARLHRKRQTEQHFWLQDLNRLLKSIIAEAEQEIYDRMHGEVVHLDPEDES